MYIYIVVEQYFDGCNFWDTEKEYYQSKDRADFRVLQMEKLYQELKEKSYAAYVKEVEVFTGGENDWYE